MRDEGQERVQATYRDNDDRLVEVKDRYDADRLFHGNPNIRPTAGAAALRPQASRKEKHPGWII